MSEEIHEVEIDRSGWEPGPWDGEPDRWEDRELGFPILAVRNHRGEWCGYVGVPPGHPWHGRGYDDVNDDELEAHGGLTYAGACNGKICHLPREGEPAAVWWLGFDCGHSGDLSPSDTTHERRRMHDDICRQLGINSRSSDVYRTLSYVQEQTRRMAAAAAAAAR